MKVFTCKSYTCTKQSSTRSEVCEVQAQAETKYFSWKNDLKSLQSKSKQKPSTSPEKEIPVHPWTKLVTDIFQFEGANYLSIVDYTSRSPIVCKLSSVNGVHVANQCKQIFSKYGWPQTLITDNGPCYT